MKKYWKQFAEWVTGLKFRPFRNARAKLTGLYVLNTIIILGVFLLALGYFRQQYIQADLVAGLSPTSGALSFVQALSSRIQTVIVILAIFILIAVGALNYFFVRITLQPIRNFMERQRRFISDASHELRTPLATMKTENEVALLDPDSLSRDEAVALLQSNVEEVDRMSTILNNLLNLASFSSATGAPPFNSVNLSAVANHVLESIRMLAKRKGIQIEASKLPSVLVWGNPTALEEVVSNLLKNSIQYTPAGGKIEISVKQDPKEKRGELKVQDTGVGISEQELPYIFEPFYRSDKSIHMHKQGTGLGLPLVREIVNRHRGTIEVKSETDKGTSVSVFIPLAPSGKKAA